MKRIPALVLFAILMANTAGFYVYYAITLQRIHREMRAAIRTLPDDKLSRLALTDDEYKKSIVEDGEIKVAGKMFDVARIKQRGDSVIVFALHDEKEDNLLALADEIVSKPFKQDAGVTSSVVHFISMIFLPGEHVTVLSATGKDVRHDSGYFDLDLSIAQKKVSPPPEKHHIS